MLRKELYFIAAVLFTAIFVAGCSDGDDNVNGNTNVVKYPFLQKGNTWTYECVMTVEEEISYTEVRTIDSVMDTTMYYRDIVMYLMQQGVEYYPIHFWDKVAGCLYEGGVYVDGANYLDPHPLAYLGRMSVGTKWESEDGRRVNKVVATENVLGYDCCKIEDWRDDVLSRTYWFSEEVGLVKSESDIGVKLKMQLKSVNF